ncbi:MAG: OmpA family protein [Halofilum sp. (in: g-proteobacteria)]
MCKARYIAAVAVLGLLAGCAADDPNRRAKTGAMVGAIVGTVIGNQGDGRSDRLMGAGIGALGGATVGSYMDRQQRELDQRLADEQRRESLAITEVGDDALRVGIASDATFAFDSADIQPASRGTYDKIANVLADYDKTIIHIVGHTDSVGSDNYNLGLSEERARSVGEHLLGGGVNGDRLIYYGMGERQAVASNDTAEGRQQNRRVEIFIKPIVEDDERGAYQPPPGVRG